MLVRVVLAEPAFPPSAHAATGPARVVDFPPITPTPEHRRGDEPRPRLVGTSLETGEPSIVHERVVVEKAHVFAIHMAHRLVARFIGGDHGVAVDECQIPIGRQPFEPAPDLPW